MFGSSLLTFAMQRVDVLLMFFVFIYVYWCSTQSPCQMMFLYFNRNKIGVTSEAATANTSGAPEFAPGF
jgi:hypothetical protein